MTDTDLEIRLREIALADVAGLVDAAKSYGDSWKRRGGVGAFMMLARKWDRLENRVANHHHDVFEAIRLDTRREGAIDDVRDLRRYLMLVEDEMTRYMHKSLVDKIARGEVSVKVVETTVKPVAFEGVPPRVCSLCLVHPATLLCYGPRLATAPVCAKCWAEGAHDAPAHKAGYANANELRA
jgi:hypothetical protein